MRTDLQVIQSAIGDVDFKEIKLHLEKPFKNFQLYTVHLPEKFRGLPMKWFFAVLSELEEAKKSLDIQRSIINEARGIISNARNESILPLVVICDDPSLHIRHQLPNNKEVILFLERNELPTTNFQARDVRNSPIMLAAKSKFSMKEAPLVLSPYSPYEPVNDWRFFGRKKELCELLESNSNFFIVGSRKIGKTSLLQETFRQMKDRGSNVYWIPVQSFSRIQEVVDEIARNLSMRDFYQSQQQAKIIDNNYLATIIKRLKGDKKELVLILDEIGNVLLRDKRDDWNFVGTLRELSQNSDIRIIASAFQEIFIKQYYEPDGPFVNFGQIQKINVFNKIEIEELIINPLSFWCDVGDKNELNRLIQTKIGRHPLFLQYLGKLLFRKIFDRRGRKVEQLLQEILVSDDLLEFENAIKEIFVVENTYLERFLFLQFCQQASRDGYEVSNIDITHRTINQLLLAIEIQTNLDERSFLLDKMALRGLLYQDTKNRSIYRVATPIVYYYYCQYDSIENLCIDFLEEIKQGHISIKPVV